MERERFDRLARLVAASATRRAATRAAFGAALAGLGLVPAGGGDEAEARGRRRKHRKHCLRITQACFSLALPGCCSGPCGCAGGNCTCRSKTCLDGGEQGCRTDADCCAGSCVSFGGPSSCLV